MYSPKKHNCLFSLLAAGAALFLVPPCLFAGILLVDDFSTGSGKPESRAAEIDRTGIANNAWNWGNSRAHIERGAVISSHTGEAAQGIIAIPAPSAEEAGIIETRAAFLINTSDETGAWPGNQIEWVGVGFLATPGSAWLAKNGGNKLWALVRPDGRWNLFSDGTATMLVPDGKSVAAPKRGELTHLALRYNPANAQAALFIDGINVSGWVPTDVRPSDIGAAGFRLDSRPGRDPSVASHPRSANLERISVVTLLADTTSVRFTPADFGARGDGVHDDAPAIQATLNAGYPVLFEQKTYLLNTGIVVSRQTGLRIDLSGATLVKANNGTFTLRIADSSDISVQGGIFVCQTMPNGYSKSLDAHGIMVVRCANVTFRDIHINGSSQMGICIMECNGVLAENNFIENCYRDGIYSHYTVNVRYLNNRLRHIKDDALSYHDYGLPEVKARMKNRTGYEQGGRVIISGNLISNAIQGIASIGCDQVTITNNIIEDTVNAGVCVFNSDRLGLPGGGKPDAPVLATSQVSKVIIASNQITRAALDGTRIMEKSYKNGLPGCTARAAICAQSQGYDHMYPTSTRRLSNIVITGNLVTHSGTEGIFANKVDNLTVLGNTLVDCNVNNSGNTPDMIDIVETTGLYLANNSIIDTRAAPLHVRGIFLRQSAGHVGDNYIQGFSTQAVDYTGSKIQTN
ncbi:hypothetical protein OpiT1DRAFT_00725 [Opitutaceae bacterium TAV1]|nr:hypothetical protein OpiT1DRAFT_00725 [Opitutaceae bacterium TAV1]